MATEQSTITTTRTNNMLACRIGPFKEPSSTRVWVFTVYNNSGTVTVYSHYTTDVSGSWTEGATQQMWTGGSTAGVRIDCVQDGTTIHIACYDNDPAGRLDYVAFTMGSGGGSYGTPEAVEAQSGPTNYSTGWTTLCIELCTNASWDVVIHYPGYQTKVMGTGYARQHIAKRSSGGSWTSDIALVDGTTFADSDEENHYGYGSGVSGSGDESHWSIDKVGEGGMLSYDPTDDSVAYVSIMSNTPTGFETAFGYDDAGTFRVRTISAYTTLVYNTEEDANDELQNETDANDLLASWFSSGLGTASSVPGIYSSIDDTEYWVAESTDTTDGGDDGIKLYSRSGGAGGSEFAYEALVQGSPAANEWGRYGGLFVIDRDGSNYLDAIEYDSTNERCHYWEIKEIAAAAAASLLLPTARWAMMDRNVNLRR